MDDFGFPQKYDGIMIESKDKVVTINSTVCISPFNTKTKLWCCGLMIVTSMNDAIKSKYKKVTKDENVVMFMNKYYSDKGDKHGNRK